MDTPQTFWRYSYPQCQGHPEPLNQNCNRRKTGLVHHLCKTDYESIHYEQNRIHLGLVISCHRYLLEVIKEVKNRLSLPVGVVEAPETTSPDTSIPPIPPLRPQTTVTCNNNGSSQSIPTNAAPQKNRFTTSIS